MEQQNFVVSVPGTIAAQETFVLNLQNSVTAKSPSGAVFSRWNRFLALWCLGIFFFGGLLGQGYDTLDLTGSSFQIVAPQVTLDQGETVTVDIITGEVIQAYEVDGYLELGTGAVFPNEPEVSLVNSWFFTDTAVPLTLGANAITRRLTFQGTSATPQSGNGILFQVTLEANEDGVSASDLVAGGGCLVVVDDLGFNPVLSSVEARIRPRMYPNPCHDRLKVDWQETQPRSIRVYDQEGNPVMEQKMGPVLPSGFSLGHLPRGLYMVVVEYEDHRLVEKLLLM